MKTFYESTFHISASDMLIVRTFHSLSYEVLITNLEAAVEDWANFSCLLRWFLLRWKAWYGVVFSDMVFISAR